MTRASAVASDADVERLEQMRRKARDPTPKEQELTDWANKMLGREDASPVQKRAAQGYLASIKQARMGREGDAEATWAREVVDMNESLKSADGSLDKMVQGQKDQIAADRKMIEKQTDDFLKGMSKSDEDTRTALLSNILASKITDRDTREGMARALATGQGVERYADNVDPALAKDLLGGGQLSLRGDSASMLNRRAADDLILQVGSNGVKFAHRVDPGDVGVFSKPGGAISQAGGGGSKGGSVNIFHLYNDGPGVMRSIEKAQKAGVIG